MSRDSRKLFSSIEQLGRFSPGLLVRFAHKHPQDFAELIKSGEIPTEDKADTINLAAIVSVLMKSGVSDELSDAMFLINVLATPRNRRLLEDEAAHIKSRRQLDFPKGLSDADFAMTLWLLRPTILEAALNRVALKSRRTFHYYLPANTEDAANAPDMTDARIATLAKLLRDAHTADGRPLGVAVIPFLESGDEDWYLVRRSRLPERISYFEDNDEEKHKSVRMRVYDVVVFDRTTGVLKVNARDEIQELYRLAFSEAYFGRIGFFEKKDIFHLTVLKSADARIVSCEGLVGLAGVDLWKVGYSINEDGAPIDYEAKRKHWYSTTRGVKAPVPPEAEGISFATFDVTFKNHRLSRRCRVDRGNTLSYSRDDDAKAFEAFLRTRGFIRGMAILTSDRAA